jgi:hypothetical protein
MSGSMKNSNLIHPVFSASGLSALYIFFTLETKVMGRLSCTEGDKEVDDLEGFPMTIVQIDFLNRSVITVLYVESTITMYNLS